LEKDLQRVVQRLEGDGCLVLKGATDLSPVESMLSTDRGPFDSVSKDIVLNNVSKVLISRYLL
jgi:hypothetical protein